MPEPLLRLLKQLSLEPLADDVFLGESTDLLGTGRIFGGQVLGQSLMAASLTVDSERKVHSMHSYFVRPGDVSIPIRFEVEHVRDGRSFSVRRVVAYQENKHIFTMSASYQVPEEGFDFQIPMPQVPDPENFISEKELARTYESVIPRSVSQRHLIDGNPIEIRVPHPEHYFVPGKYDPKNFVWFRINGEMPNTELLNKATFAYFSDFYMLFTTLLPHNQTAFDKNLQMATLDHTIWFHRPIDMNQWHLFCIETTNASGARGLAFAHAFNLKGDLVATVSQEGLIRHATRFNSEATS